MIPWTREQAAAITSTEDTLLVANAGTGKTTTIVGKILWLLGFDVGTDAATGEPIPRCPDPCDLSEIAAITFTEKAAHDLKAKLRERIAAQPGGDALRWELDRASVGTIHSYCGALLREHALRLGIDPTFEIVDPRQARGALDDIIRRVALDALAAGDDATARLYRDWRLHGYTNTAGLVDVVRAVFRDLRWRGDRYRDWCRPDGALDSGVLARLAGDLDPKDEAIVQACEALHRLASRTLAEWNRYQAKENVRDYDGLILDARELLTGPGGAPAIASIRKRTRVLIIDEFQDTDFAQRDIAFAIGHGAARPQLFLVGDPKQSIYRFRGADIAVWSEVEAALSGSGRVLSLTQNFRSVPGVIEFANTASEVAIEGTGEALEEELPGSRVRYSPLEPARSASGDGAVEWLAAEGGSAGDRRDAEAAFLARQIRQLVDGGESIVDPETRQLRPCRYRDIAVLYRTRTGIERYEAALARHGVPVFLAAQGALHEQQEVADVINALRLIDNPWDDLAAFAYLRSPFVGLRDETLARIALGRGSRSLLWEAKRYVREEQWWSPADHPDLVEAEREALTRGVGAIDEAVELATRVGLDELIDGLLEATGYPLHLMLLGESREALANLQTLRRIAEDHCDRPLGTFLELWDGWDEQDQGFPQAPLYSSDDDVVTVTTIHRAKGLEWPVVFLIDAASDRTTTRSREYWSDRDHGPVIAVRQADLGPRGELLLRRNELEAAGEDARILYVALTRARDRLTILGPTDAGKGWIPWLEGARVACGVPARRDAADIEPVDAPPALSLELLPVVRGGEPSKLARPAAEPPHRFVTSATEIMMRENEPEQWELRYRHGVEPSWEFAPSGNGDGGVPAHVRGTIIHGVLERIQEERELARILEEVVGEVDSPELEEYLGTGSSYREALEEEIARVVASDEWRWYTEGEHYRELGFVHLAGGREWRAGAFDLFRVDPTQPLIVDFKTHDLAAGGAAALAAQYAAQVNVYHQACGSSASIVLYFTGPRIAWKASLTDRDIS